jgi:hypothetical protein
MGTPKSLEKKERELRRKRKRALRRWWHRRLLVLFCLVALAGSLLFLPIPIGGLKTRVREATARRLGVDLELGGAWITVALGRIELRDAVARDRETGQHLISFHRVELSGLPESLFGLRGAWPREILLEEGGVLELQAGSDGFRFAPALEQLLRESGSLRTGTPTRHRDRSARWKWPFVTIHRIPIHITTPGGPFEGLAIFLDELVFVPSAFHSEDFQVQVHGRLNQRKPASLQGQLAYRGGDNRWELDLAVSELRGTVPLPAEPSPGHWQTQKVKLKGYWQSNEADGNYLHAELQTGRLVLFADAREVHPLFDSPLRLSLDATQSPSDATWMIHPLRLEGPQIGLSLGGDVLAEPPFSFTLDAVLTRIPDYFYDQAAVQLATQGIAFDLPGTSTLQLAAQARGRLDQLLETTLTGRVSLGAVRLRYPAMPGELFLEQVEGQLRRTGAVLEIGRWRLGKLGGRATATLDGFPLAGHEARLVADMHIEGGAEELLRFGRALQFVPPVIEEFTAQLRGQGSVECRLALHEKALLPRDIRWRGQVHWTGGRLHIAPLHDPVLMESGSLEFYPDRLELVRLRTTLGDMEARWKASLLGRDYFWIQPVARLDGEVESSIPSFARFLHWTHLGLPDPGGVTGQLGLRFWWEGPMNRLEQGHWEVQARARALEFQLPLPGDVASVRNLGFNLTLSTDTVRLSQLRGDVDDIGIEAEGRADNQFLRVETRVRAPLQTVIRLFSDEIGEFRGEGIVPAHAVFEMVPRNGLPLPAHPSALRWATLLSTTDSLSLSPESPVEMRLDATLMPNGVSFWQEDMPHPVTNIRGRVKADLTGLQLDQVRSQWADVPDCIVNGRVQLHPKPTRVFFDLEMPRLAIDQWITGWSQPPDGIHARRKPHKDSGPRLSTLLHGTLRSREATLYRMKGTDLSGTLQYENWRGLPNRLDLRSLRAVCYDGLVSGSMSLQLEPREHQSRFQLTAIPRNIEIQPFITDLFGKEDKTVGQIDGYLKLAGDFSDLATLEGEGSFLLSNTRILGGPIFPLLGKILRSMLVQDTTFSSIQSGFGISRRKIHFDGIKFDSPGVRLLGEGTVDFDGMLDMNVTVGMHSKTLDQIPGVRFLVNLVREVGARFLKFHLKGSLGNPQINPIPFSVDLLTRFIRETNSEPEPIKTPTPTPNPTPPAW